MLNVDTDGLYARVFSTASTTGVENVAVTCVSSDTRPFGLRRLLANYNTTG